MWLVWDKLPEQERNILIGNHEHILTCLGQALDKNKSLHADWDWRNQLILYDNIDAALMVEIDIDERKFPLLHVVKAINKRSLQDIHHEIREYLNMTISFDHVVVDGAPAARFIKEFVQLIEGGFRLSIEKRVNILI